MHNCQLRPDLHFSSPALLWRAHVDHDVRVFSSTHSRLKSHFAVHQAPGTVWSTGLFASVLLALLAQIATDSTQTLPQLATLPDEAGSSQAPFLLKKDIYTLTKQRALQSVPLRRAVRTHQTILNVLVRDATAIVLPCRGGLSIDETSGLAVTVGKARPMLEKTLPQTGLDNQQ